MDEVHHDVPIRISDQNRAARILRAVAKAATGEALPREGAGIRDLLREMRTNRGTPG